MCVSKYLQLNRLLTQEVKDHLLREAESSSGKENALVIDGKSLMFALDPSAKDLFLRVALKCKSVICCRFVLFIFAKFTRLQKQVKVIRRS